MSTFNFFQRCRKLLPLLVLIALPTLAYTQDCPPPTAVTVIYDPNETPWESYLNWIEPSAECPIQGFEIEYATYNFVPGTGAESGSLIVGGPIVVIPEAPSPNSLYVFIRTLCDPPCNGPFGGPDGSPASEWVLADLFIAPPPPPPPADGVGQCSDAADALPMDDYCLDESPFNFWGAWEGTYHSTNPCTGDLEYMIWQEYIAPPLGGVTISADIISDPFQEDIPETFGIVIYDQDCNGSILVCDTNLTGNDTLSLSLTPGESFTLGAWLNNAQYVVSTPFPDPDYYYNFELDLSVCEVEPDCAYPINITVSNITDQSAVINWNADEVDTWLLEYGLVGFDPGTGTEVIIEEDSSYLLEELSEDSAYDFYLRSICDGQVSSLNIGPNPFTTLPSISIVEAIPDGYLYCCDDLVLPESTEVEAFCDSVYFTHADSLVGSECPYTIHRTITVHDTCGNSIQTTFHYDILDNKIPCGCTSETIVEQEEAERRVAIHGDWAVLHKGDFDEIYHFEDGSWTLNDTLYTSSGWAKSLAIYDDVIVDENNVYRLEGDTWTLETVLEPSVTVNSSYYKVAIYGHTIAYALGDSIFIFEYADESWSEVTLIPHGAYALDLGESVLLTAAEFDDHIGRIYRKTGGIWAFEQELPNYFPNNEGNGIGADAAIDGNFAAIGYSWGGGLFTYTFNGSEWEPEEFLTNPYQVNPGGGYATCFGRQVDIEDDLMVVGDYFNAVNGNFSGSVAVFERSCGQWEPQRNIVPSNGMEDQRFGGCLDLMGGRMVVGIDTQYWLGGITYQGIGHYWFYECLDAQPTFSLTTDSELFVNCATDIPPSDLSYTLGNAWCSSTEVVINSDTTGTGCNLVITREFSVADSLGNTASATQEITFTDDLAPEVIEPPIDVNLTCLDNLEEYEPEFTDNCTDTLQVIFSVDTVTTGCNTLIEQAWIATDDCGNSTEVSRTISIEIEPPFAAIIPDDLAFTCSENIEYDNDEPVFITHCQDSMEIIFEADTIGEECPLIIQSWTAFNQCGGSTTVSRTITLVNEPPAIASAPEDLNITCSENWEFEEPIFTDDCSAEFDVTFTVDTVLNDGCTTTIEYTWEAIDNCGNSTSTERTITIVDDEAPSFDCPDDFTVFVLPDETYTLGNILDSISTSDNCASVVLTQSIPTGTELEPGIHNISLNATDGCFDLVCVVEIEVAVGTGIDLNNQSPVDIFPNPTLGALNIALPYSEKITVQLFDMAGKVVLNEQHNSENILMELGGLAKGVYSIQVKGKTIQFTQKVLLE